MVSGPVRVQRVIRFGDDFELDLRAFELRRAGRPLKLERIPLQILLLLIEHNQQLVTREEIIEQIWGKDVFLDTDNSINGAIRKIRQALRDDPEQPRFVQTVTGLGYRFIAEVVENGHEPPLSQTPLRDDSSGQAEVPQARTKSLSLRIASAFLALLAAGAIVVFAVVLTRSHASPFQTVKTVRLTSGGQSGKAAISPDGSYIAHTVISSGQESLRLRRANMLSDVELVPPQQVRYLGLTFSRDSQSVYYVAQKTGDEPGTLYRVSVIGGAPQKINDHLDSSISFSPDGKRYAFVRESATASTLLIADLDSGLERVVISRKLPEVLDYPAWSPDERTITVTDTDASVVSPRGSNARLVQVRIADGKEHDLSSQRWGFIREIAWLQDQRGLVMSARSPEESGFFHLWYVSYPEGAARQITEGVYRQRGVSISADSRQMITVQENAFSSIWRIRSLRDAAPELVVSGESGTSAPVWTAGGRIIFEEELNGRRSIFSVSPDGSNRKELTLAGNNNNYDASVSGNGGLLAFVSDRSGTPAIWTMDLESGKSQLLTKATGEPVPQLSTDATGAAVPQLSSDGTWIAFTAIGSRHWTTLWRIPSVGGQAKELNDKFWLRPLISPDGNWIAGFYDDGQLNTQTKPTSIAVISSNGGTPQKVFHIPFSVVVSGGIRWSRDGHALCYINSGKGGSNIWEQPISGGPPRQITSFEGVDLFSFDWSPDGKQLTFSRGLQARDVVLVEDIRRK